MSSKIVFLASASLTVLVYSIAYERFKRSFTITRSRTLSAVISLGFYFFLRRLFARKKNNTKKIDASTTKERTLSQPETETATNIVVAAPVNNGDKTTDEISEAPLSIEEKDIPRYEDEEENLTKRIDTSFLDAVANIRTNKSLDAPNDMKLKLYGLFKQANIGPNTTTRPGFFDPVGGAKWDAWMACKALSPKEAKLQYIQVVSELDTSWNNGSIVADLQAFEEKSKNPQDDVGESSKQIASAATEEDNDQNQKKEKGENMSLWNEPLCPVKYKDTIEAKFKTFLERVKGDRDNVNKYWSFNFEQNGVCCFVPHNSDFPGAKGIGILNYPTRAVFEIIKRCGDPDDTLAYRKDPDMKEIDVLERLNEQTSVQYLEYKAVWPVSGRDFTNITHWRRLRNGCFIFAGFTFEYEKRPPISGLVRAETIIGGWHLEPLENGMKTKLTYIVELDFKGSIPSFVVSQVTKKQPMQIDIIRTFLEEEENNCGGRDRFLKKYEDLDNIVNLGNVVQNNDDNDNNRDDDDNQIDNNVKPMSTRVALTVTDEKSPGSVARGARNDTAPANVPSPKRRASIRNSPKRPIGRNSWSEDKRHKVCEECSVAFSFTVRRHHCRYCGRLLCDKCSKYLINDKRACLTCLNNDAIEDIDGSELY